MESDFGWLLSPDPVAVLEKLPFPHWNLAARRRVIGDGRSEVL
jgi:hypothetical protein